MVRLSRIKVSAWEGNIMPTGLTNAPPTEDFIYLANNDKASGELQSVVDGAFAFNTPVGDFEIPASRVTHVQFGKNDSTKTEIPDEIVRAHFRDGSAVSFRLDEWTATEVKGVSPTFGEVAFKTPLIQHLDFNLARAEELGDKDDEFW